MAETGDSSELALIRGPSDPAGPNARRPERTGSGWPAFAGTMVLIAALLIGNRSAWGVLFPADHRDGN